MHINIVTVSSGWILQKIAERMSANNKVEGITMSVSHQPDMNADANYYVDLQNCYFGTKTKCDVAYFTHADENSPQWLTQLLLARKAFTLDGIISMNQRYTEMLEDVGFPVPKLVTITPGQTYDTFPIKPITIGVVSRGGWPGYGQGFMEQVFETVDLEHFKFKFLGNGWDALTPIAARKGIRLELLPDADYSIYPAFYHSIDYLLIPGLWTAGPISMQEALSCGIPIIASDVGFVGYEFRADHVFKPNDVNGLSSILNQLINPILNRRSQVENMTWNKYSKDVVEFIQSVKKPSK